ncbi:MAG: hypothetical protein ACREEQ_06620 [Caulobacteraceae bacterium]
MSSLLTTPHIAGDVRAHLARLGEVFADFGDADAGCFGHGVAAAGGRYFVKHVVKDHGLAAQDRAIALHRAVRHPALPPLLAKIAGGRGPVLVYPWIEGVRLRESRLTGRLALHETLDAIWTVIDVHRAIAAAGFVSIDLYDGNMLYGDRLHLIDVDEYERSPHRLVEERTPGSTRFMAPEEFRKGSLLDERTCVFHLGRTVAVLLDPPEGLSLARAPRLQPLVERATDPDPDRRFQTVEALASAWIAARSLVETA